VGANPGQRHHGVETRRTQDLWEPQRVEAECVDVVAQPTQADGVEAGGAGANADAHLHEIEPPIRRDDTPIGSVRGTGDGSLRLLDTGVVHVVVGHQADEAGRDRVSEHPL